MTLVLFPLSAHLLPGGIMPLRIFEPRYQRMIAEAQEREFALCMLDPASPMRCATCIPSPPGCGSSISICCRTACSASQCSGWSGSK